MNYKNDYNCFWLLLTCLNLGMKFLKKDPTTVLACMFQSRYLPDTHFNHQLSKLRKHYST